MLEKQAATHSAASFNLVALIQPHALDVTAMSQKSLASLGLSEF
jgi:hypothetical protein